jgi:hypothetical protein
MTRKVAFVSLLLVLSAGITPGARAQANAPIESFWVASSDVTTLVPSGGLLYLTGLFDVVGPYTGNSVRIDAGTGLVDLSFPKVEGSVSAVVPDGSGGWYLGGSFTRVGTVTRNNLAHILADGRLSSWNPNPNNTVTAIVVSGQKVYVAGSFTIIGGQARGGLAALDTVTGQPDAFNPTVGNFAFNLALVGNTLYLSGNFTTAGGQPRNRAAAVDATTGALLPFDPDVGANVVSDMAVYGNTVFLGGQFGTVGGQSRSQLAAVDADSGALQPWNPSPSNPVNSLQVVGNTLYVGGAFSSIAGQSRNRLAAFDLPGLTLTSWNPNVTGQYVTAIDVDAGTVYIGGPFTGVGGQERYNLAAVDASTAAVLAWNPVADGSTTDLAEAGGHVFVGGLAVSYNGKVRHRAAALDAATGVATSWDPRGSNIVDALVVSPSAVYIGGQFGTAGGQPRSNIAALDPATGDALPWNPGATLSVDALALVGGTLYAGGQFTTIGGQSRNRIAALDASTGIVSAWNPGSTATVNALVSDGTNLYLGTGTSTIDTQTRRGLAAFDVSTGSLLAWNPDATGGSVTTLALRGAEVLAGGNFTSVGGQTRNRVAAVDATGAPTAWDPNANLGATAPTVRGLADAGDRILAAGSFTSIGGGGAYVAALNTVTGANLGFGPGLGAAANAVAASGNLVYVGGTFTTVGGRPRRGLAAFCRAPAPTALVATPGANLVDLVWSPTGAPQYRVYRALAATGPYESIGTTAVPAFTDPTVQSGITYYYRVRAFDGCESPFSNTASATPTGSCQLPPVFEGLAWAEQGTGGTCSVAMGWAPATDPCGGGVFYSLYRDTSPAFVPSLATLVATVSAGTTYTDTTPLVPGTTYYYVVRATSQGSQQEEANLFRRAVTPVSCTAGTPGTASGFTVTSRDSENVLQWVNPPGYGTVRIRYNSGVSCTSPAGPLLSGTLLDDYAGSAGQPVRYPHTPVANDTTYCYTLFVDTGGGTWSAGSSNSGRPFDSDGDVKWAFSSGLFSTTPPTVGGAGIIATNNAGAVHAMARGASLGEWPAGWLPAQLGGVVQGRSPVVPIAVNGATPVVFLGAQDGNVYALDGAKGGAAAPTPWLAPTSIAGMVQAAPAGIFTAFGAAYNYLLLGSRDDGADNAFVALDPFTGSEAGRYAPVSDPDRIGIVSGAASVEYLTPPRVYFASRRRSAASTRTLWRLNIGTSPALAFAWARDDLDDIDSSPVVRGGRVYVGSAAAGGTLFSLDTAAGADDRTFVHADGQVKSFVFPDRVSPTGDLAFSTDTKVWVVSDDAGTLTPRWPAGISLGGTVTPSAALLVRGLSSPTSQHVFVGASDGRLYQIEVSGGTPVIRSVVLGDGSSTVGAPSFDRDNNLVHVGTAAGIFYAVLVPLP